MNHQPNTPASLNEAVEAIRELLGHLSDVLPDEVFNKIDTAKWNAVSSLAAPGAAIDAREQPTDEQLLDAARSAGMFGFEDHGRKPLLRFARTMLASRQEAPADQEDGYASAFYELGKLMGIPAQPISPERVWREQMLPTLQKALAVRIASRDTALLDFMQRHRVAVIPEFEGPWDAEIYGEDEAPNARGSGNTPREAIDAARAALASQPDRAVEGEALSPATVAQPVALTDAELGAAAYKGFDDYWTEDSPGKERDAWTASAKAVLKLAQPCASQGCGGAVQEAVANVVSCWNRFRWAKETSDAVSALAALSTAPRSLDGATPGGKE